ncbi:aspartate-semialdehyde dehydrogenase [Microbulbifer marinus]|uniref:Aspartate-semialdehyde dehydrogenase n=1 Tax=Microbulbifer marinus TaxID=658218 RepID=A0A1H4AEN6_9GAMM|nr:aspartate-semialdehyde dehydrogenase [Microbulbifer marinus]SEA33994.1 hypothetical protein SAMN05216562_2709 [Microbulbifer marinus]
MNNFDFVAASLLDQAKADKFSGYDPFDGLNSKLFDVLPVLRSGPLGLAWIQFFKRSPFNFRTLLCVPKRRNPKGIALFILGMLEDFDRTKDANYLQQATDLAEWLLQQQCDRTTWQHSCWGYHFDWNARAFFVPKGKPNVITTIYVAQALYALAKVTGESKFLQSALDAGHFIVKTLYTEAEGRCFFAYIPGEVAFVHNASLWAAAWVAIVARDTENAVYRELALKVARQSVMEQAEDGSWVYGARHHHQFIDGFHTGYNLEALDLIRRSLEVSEFDNSIDKGFAYYKRVFFEEDGTAKYYHDNRYPLDMHSVAQAVLTLIKVGGREEDLALADRIIRRALDTLYLPRQGRFVYQKTKRFTNRINYMRWTQAWVYYSFAAFNNSLKKQ